MPKTRQQRLAEEQAGHASSPPQILADKSRVPRRTRAKTPSAYHNTVAAEPVVPDAQLAAPGLEAPQALVHVWVDENRYVYDPSHELTIPSALVPELVVFINKLRDHGTQNSVASSSSTAQVTPSLNRPQLAQTSGTEPKLPEPSAPIAPQHASAGVVSPFLETSPPMLTNASSAREQPFQPFSGPAAPLNTRPHIQSPPQETDRSLTPHDSPIALSEVTFQQIAPPVQSICNNKPVHTIPQSVTPTHVVQQAVNTSGRSGIVDKQASDQEMPDQQVNEVVQRNQKMSVSSSKSQTGASGVARRKRRAMSGKPSASAPIKKKLGPVPSDPKIIHALGLPSIFRKYRQLPTYTADGQALYGQVPPSDNYMRFHDEAPANTDSSMANTSTSQTSQASGSSVPGRLIRRTHSVKKRFGFSPLTTISERDETTPPMQPAKSRPAMRVPSRLFHRVKANKRKRWTSPESIPNPKGKSYGLGEVELYGNAEEDEDKIAGQKPGKVRRTSHLENFSSQGAVNSDSSRPCTGQQSIIPKTPIPVTNAAGSFKVPSPGDSDWSDSESEHAASSQAAASSTPTTTTNPGPTSLQRFRANAYGDWLKTASPAAAAVVEQMEVGHTAVSQAFEAVLNSNPPPTSRPRFKAMEDWLRTASPSVAAALEQMDVDPNVAGTAFQRGLENYTSS